jgi:hypothetical protein
VSARIEDVDLLVVSGGKAGKALAMDEAKAGGSGHRNGSLLSELSQAPGLAADRR